MVVKTPEGTLRWLEKGNIKGGLFHMYQEHAGDYARRKIDNVPLFLYRMLQTAPEKTMIDERGPSALYIVDGKKYLLAYGTNGFIVSFHPLPDDKE